MKTKTIKIAVAVSDTGSWHAYGADNEAIKECVNMATEGLSAEAGQHCHVVHVTTTIEVPAKRKQIETFGRAKVIHSVKPQRGGARASRSSVRTGGRS